MTPYFDFSSKTQIWQKCHLRTYCIQQTICVVYITTKSPYQNLLTEHLLDTVDYLRAKYPDIGVMITDDFNSMNVNHLCRGNDLYQIIDFPLGQMQPLI